MSGHGTKDQKHDVSTILKSMMIADMLKSRSFLADAIVHVADLMMPAGAAQQVRDLMEQGYAKVASASTLIRAQLVLDAGYMYWWQHRYAAISQAGGVTMVALTDASQTADREWMVTEVHMVRNADLEALGDSVDDLWQLRQTYHDEEDEALIERLQTLNQRIIRVLNSHLLPPMVLGAKLTDIVHKIFRILWKFYLET